MFESMVVIALAGRRRVLVDGSNTVQRGTCDEQARQSGGVLCWYSGLNKW